MTNISKHSLDTHIQDQLFAQLTELFATANERSLGKMLNALFTPAEKIMFIKRLAVIFLIDEGYSNYMISKQLFVSDTTVRTIRTQFSDGRYDALCATTHTKSFKKKEFWKTVELLLRAGLPPRGKGRWKWLFDTQ